MCSVRTQPEIVVLRQGKAALDSGESTRAASNRVNLGDLNVSISGLRAQNLARGHIHMFVRGDNCRIDCVSIGRYPFTRTCAS